jgi:response regulator RpfG family c-di-GMP phosphodiesterase
MHVILVDDDDVINLVHSEVIKRIVPEIEMHIFRSGTQLIQYLNSPDRTYFDILFLDIRMPEMDGFEVLEKLGQMDHLNLSGSRIFVLSSTLDERDLNRARSNALVTDFISKPLSFATIKEMVSK